MAENLAVKPGYLEGLAKEQDEASKKAGYVATQAKDLGNDLWKSHGVISFWSNLGGASTEEGRRKAGKALAAAASDLAAKLRTADNAYQTIDEEMADNLSKQVLDRRSRTAPGSITALLKPKPPTEADFFR